jgi:hypothetical protein
VVGSGLVSSSVVVVVVWSESMKKNGVVVVAIERTVFVVFVREKEKSESESWVLEDQKKLGIFKI